MPDSNLSAGNERLRFEVARRCVALEIRSWLPEHKAGGGTVTLDGRELPGEVGATLPGALHVLALAPGEWLLVSNDPSAIGSVAAVTQRFAASLAKQGAVLTDATDGLAVVNISGSAARDVLSKGCGLDFHPQAFPVGRCARTRFAQLPVIVDHVDAAPSFDLYVARSYLRSLATWLEDAAVEFNSSPS